MIDGGVDIQTNPYGYVIDNEFYLRFDGNERERKALQNKMITHFFGLLNNKKAYNARAKMGLIDSKKALNNFKTYQKQDLSKSEREQRTISQRKYSSQLHLDSVRRLKLEELRNKALQKEKKECSFSPKINRKRTPNRDLALQNRLSLPL